MFPPLSLFPLFPVSLSAAHRDRGRLAGCVPAQRRPLSVSWPQRGAARPPHLAAVIAAGCFSPRPLPALIGEGLGDFMYFWLVVNSMRLRGVMPSLTVGDMFLGGSFFLRNQPNAFIWWLHFLCNSIYFVLSFCRFVFLFIPTCGKKQKRKASTSQQTAQLQLQTIPQRTKQGSTNHTLNQETNNQMNCFPALLSLHPFVFMRCCVLLMVWRLCPASGCCVRGISPHTTPISSSTV